VIVITALLTWLGDFLFWNHSPGISVAIFVTFAVAALLALPDHSRPTRAAGVAAVLLLFSSGASFLEISFTNITVLIALLAVLMAERHYQELAAGWSRWSESFIAWLCAPGRWLWLTRSMVESELVKIGFNSVTTDRVAKSIQILAPAACLAFVFGIVLSGGNAVFRQLLAHLTVAGGVELFLTAGVIAYLQRANLPVLRINHDAVPETDADLPALRKIGLRGALIGMVGTLLLVPLGLLASGTAFGEEGPRDLDLEKYGLRAVPAGLSKYSDWWSHSLLPGYDFKDGGHPSVGYYASALVGTILIAAVVIGSFKLAHALRRRDDAPDAPDALDEDRGAAVEQPAAAR